MHLDRQAHCFSHVAGKFSPVISHGLPVGKRKQLRGALKSHKNSRSYLGALDEIEKPSFGSVLRRCTGYKVHRVLCVLHAGISVPDQLLSPAWTSILLWVKTTKTLPKEKLLWLSEGTQLGPPVPALGLVRVPLSSARVGELEQKRLVGLLEMRNWPRPRAQRGGSFADITGQLTCPCFSSFGFTR